MIHDLYIGQISALVPPTDSFGGIGIACNQPKALPYPTDHLFA